MTEPLRIRGPRPATAATEVAVAAVVGLPVLGFLYLLVSGRPLGFEDRTLNLLLHALLVVVPLVWSVPFLPRRMKLVGSSGELLATSTHLRELRLSWWQSVLLWPALLLGLAVLGSAVAEALMGTGGPLATSAWNALLAFGLIFAFTVFYATAFLDPVEVRLTSDGIRLGLAHFVPWRDVRRMAPTPWGYELYHRASGVLPLASLRLPEEARARLATIMGQRGLPVGPGRGHRFLAVRLLVAAAASVLLAGGTWAWRSGVHGGAAVLVVFVLGLGGTLLLERVRGVREVETVKPLVEERERP